MGKDGTDGDQNAGPGHYTYEAPWTTYAFAWANTRDPQFKFAVGSFHEGETHRMQVVELNKETNRLECVAEAETLLPATKIVWGRPDLFASTCQTMNLWRVEAGQLVLVSRLANGRSYSTLSTLAPITSFDWSSSNLAKLGVSSVDTTCTIWNLEKQKVETQLIAHDSAVHDIAFGKPDTLFVSAGADGSVRLFDQRQLGYSTIIYETSPASPLLRVAWNNLNNSYVATIAMHERGVTIFDIRRPSLKLTSLVHREAFVNHLCWSPSSKRHMLCGTDDGHALIWDLASVEDTGSSGPASEGGASTARSRTGPLLAYECNDEVNQVQWNSANPDWVALGTPRGFEVLRI